MSEPFSREFIMENLQYLTPDAILAHDAALRLALETAETNEEKLHETNERLALDIVDAEDDRDDLAEILAAALDEIEVLNEVYHEDNAVCLCGCPLSEHEDNGEDGEQCEHEDHVCLRTCPAIRDLYQAALDRLEEPAPPADAATEAVRVRLCACAWCGAALVQDPDSPHRWRCINAEQRKCVARGDWYVLADDRDYVPVYPAPAPSSHALRRCEQP